MKIAIPIIFAALIFGSSCKQNIAEEKIQKIDSLTIKLDSLERLIADYDSAAINKNASIFFEQFDFVRERMKDTIEPKTAFMLDEYFALRKAFNFFRGNYSETKFQVNDQQAQLEDLKQDIENGLVEEKQVDEYIILEKSNLFMIESRTKTLNTAVNSIDRVYDELEPKVDSVINAFKAERAI